MLTQAAPGELLLFQFLMSAAFSAYNANMRRGWLANLAVMVLVVQGFAPSRAVCRCCQTKNPYGCCAPMARMHADCCANLREASALAPAAQKEAATVPGAAYRTEITPQAAGSQTASLHPAQRPPGFASPPIVLRI